VLDEARLKRVDLFVAPLPLRLGDEIMHPRNEHVLIMDRSKTPMIPDRGNALRIRHRK
jgi:hypothetical protein